jgi:hypothetical protein
VLRAAHSAPATVAAHLERSAKKMTDLAKFHEVEKFHLKGRMMSWSSIQPKIEQLGFRLMDDFIEVMRTDPIEPWQSEAIAGCNFELKGKDVYPDEENFDQIRYEILVCSLPRDIVNKSSEILFIIAHDLELEVWYGARRIQKEDFPALLDLWDSDILSAAGDVMGSESVAILKHMEYEKRRSRTSH